MSEQQLYQTPATSTIAAAAAAANWTLASSTPSMLGGHTAQTHPPVLQRNNQTVFYH